MTGVVSLSPTSIKDPEILAIMEKNRHFGVMALVNMKRLDGVFQEHLIVEDTSGIIT